MAGKRARRVVCAIALAAAAVFPEAADAQVNTVSGAAANDQIIQDQVNQVVTPVFRDSVRQTTAAVQQRLGTYLSRKGGGGTAQNSLVPQYDGETGLAGGDDFLAKAAWGDVTSTHLSSVNTAAGTTGKGKQDGFSHTMTLGLDGQTGDWVLGAAASLNFTRLDLHWTNGTSETHGITVTPYAGYTIDDVWSLDVQTSYTRSRYNLDLSDSTGDFNSDRLTVVGNVNAFKQFGAWNLTGMAGFLYAREIVHNFDLKSSGAPVRVSPGFNQLGQFKTGFETAYTIGDWEPYAGATLEVDYLNEGSDRVGAVYKGGFRYRFGGATIAGFEASTVQHRGNEENYSLGANFRLQF